VYSNMKKLSCLLLFSGGLDSLLAFKILAELGIKAYPIFFDICFVDRKKPMKYAKLYNLPLEIIDLRKKQLKVVKNPKYGYGKNLNPCIDCKILMFKEAKKIMKEKKADFIATGEVVGQRPFSQTRWALNLIEKETHLKGKILRPLSAKLLKPSEIEKKKLIQSKKLLSISGKSRKKQIALAKKYNLKEYPSPAGGCLLTDPSFCSRLKEYLKRKIDFNCQEIELLKLGRHFFLNHTKIVIGRNKNENQKIQKLKTNKDILIEPIDYPGPTALIRIYSKHELKEKEKMIKKAKQLIKLYSKKIPPNIEPVFKIS